MEQTKALIAMSGGVDSSVAAYLSRKEGLYCIGATAQLCDKALLGDAYTDQNIADARSVAQRLGMEFHTKTLLSIISSAATNKALHQTPASNATATSNSLFCWTRLLN